MTTVKLENNYFESDSERTERIREEELAAEASAIEAAKPWLKKKVERKYVLAGVGAIALTLSLTGFVVVNKDTVPNAELKQGVLSLAGEIDGTHNIDPHGDNVSKGVKWTVTGTVESYCIKAYHSKLDGGGKGSAWEPTTYDSTTGAMDTATGACSPDALKAFLNAGMGLEPMDNTDIKK
jgi:hypothetical protein